MTKSQITIFAKEIPFNENTHRHVAFNRSALCVNAQPRLSSMKAGVSSLNFTNGDGDRIKEVSGINGSEIPDKVGLYVASDLGAPFAVLK